MSFPISRNNYVSKENIVFFEPARISLTSRANNLALFLFKFIIFICSAGYLGQSYLKNWDLFYKGLDTKKELEAIERHGGWSLKRFSLETRTNKDIVFKVLKKNGLTFEHLPEKMKKQKALALVAVKQNGMAILHLPKELKKDKDIALAAVKQNGMAILHLPKELQNDPEIRQAAINQNETVQYLMS